MTTGEQGKPSDFLLQLEPVEGVGFTGALDKVIAELQANPDARITARELLGTLEGLLGELTERPSIQAPTEQVAVANPFGIDWIETPRTFLVPVSTGRGMRVSDAVGTKDIIDRHKKIIADTRAVAEIGVGHKLTLTQREAIDAYAAEISKPEHILGCLALVNAMLTSDKEENRDDNDKTRILDYADSETGEEVLAERLVKSVGPLDSEMLGELVGHSTFINGYVNLAQVLANVTESNLSALERVLSDDSVSSNYVDALGARAHESPLTVGLNEKRFSKLGSNKVLKYVENGTALWQRLGLGLLGIVEKESGEMFGTVSLGEFDWMTELFPQDQEGKWPIEFSFRLGKRRQGYGTEVLRAMLEYGFRVRKLGRIFGNAVAGNIGSIKTLKGVGFQAPPHPLRPGSLLEDPVPYRSESSGRDGAFVVLHMLSARWDEKVRQLPTSPIVGINGEPYDASRYIRQLTAQH
jgi:hypothetical protein